METETIRPIEATKVDTHLRDLLNKVDVKTACAIGIKNYVKGLVMRNPRDHVVTGKQADPFPTKVPESMAATALYVKTEYAVHGTSGCICYDLDRPDSKDYMLAILWECPFTELLKENKFNIRVMRRGDCNQSLYDELYSKLRDAGSDFAIEQGGITVHAHMSKDPKSMLIVECRAPDEGMELPLERTEPLQAGRVLEEKLRRWTDAMDSMHSCALGIQNWSDFRLQNPHMYIDAGKCIYEPPERVDSKMAAPCLFSKRDFSLRGCSGLVCYDIDEGRMLVSLFSVTFGTIVNNKFSCCIMQRRECNRDLFDHLMEGAQNASDGTVLIRDYDDCVLEGNMTADARCIYLVNLRKK